MNESRRQKKVASLLQEALSQPVADTVSESVSSLISITRIEMSPDLKKAQVFISVFDRNKNEQILDLLEKKKGYFRKSVASKTKLKYNPTLFFSLDPSSVHEENIDRIIKQIRNDDKSS